MDTAFGRLSPGPNPQSPPDAPDLPTVDGALEDLLPEAVRDEVRAYIANVPLQIGEVYNHLEDAALQMIFTAAVTDALAIIRHTLDFDGRSAALRARTLFEHLLNCCDILESSTNTAERFLDHRWVAQDLRSRRRDHLTVLGEAEARREARQLDDLAREAAQPLAEAIATYGRPFARGWADGSARSRAAKYDLADDYDGYALLSSAIHGSRGSLDGVVRRVNGANIHRAGLDLELAVIGWWEGLRWFGLLVDRIEGAAPNWATQQISQATTNLLWAWPEIRKALRKRDRQIWPTQAPPRPTTAVVIHRSRVRWYHYRPVDDIVVPVSPPDPLPDDLAARVDAARRLMTTFEGGVYARRPPLIPIPGVRLAPNDGAKAQRAAGLWPESEEQWQRFYSELTGAWARS